MGKGKEKARAPQREEEGAEPRRLPGRGALVAESTRAHTFTRAIQLAGAAD